MTGRQPLQPGHIQGRELVPCQTEPLHTPELLHDGRHAAEAVEGQAEVGQVVQKAQVHGQRTQKVTIQEESLQAGTQQQDRGGQDGNNLLFNCVTKLS